MKPAWCRLAPILTVVVLVALPALAQAGGFHGMFSPDGIDVWAVGDSGSYYRSFDGGDTWTSGFVGTTHLRAVASRQFNVVVVADSGKIWRSTIGGGNWNLTAIAGAPALRGVSFPSDLVGYAVGAGGTILKTTDGGDVWSPQTSGTAATLNGVRFVDDLTGWTVGAAGTVLRTGDGGATWTPVAVDATAELFGVDLFGLTVWVVGSDGTARRSTDGGAVWQPVDLKIRRADVRAVWLNSPNEIVLAGGGGFIRETSDGGATWFYPQHFGQGQISSILYSLPTGRAWACSNRHRAILTSVDGGVTWSLPPTATINRSWAPLVGPGALPTSAPVRGKTIDVNPFNKNTLYAALGNTVYRSPDLGETWASIGTIPNCTYLNSLIVSPRDSNLMVVAVKAPTSRVVRSTDGGQTWTTTLTHLFGDFGTPLEVDADHPDTWYFGGDSDGLFRSVDACSSWTEIGTPSFRSPCDILVVPDSSNVILIGDGVTGSGRAEYYRSIDGGTTFTMVSQRPMGTSEIPALATSRLRNSVAFGTNWGSGGVQRSQDYGATWPTVDTTPSSWGIDIAEDDPNVVLFGIYSGGASYLSFDGGVTFGTASLTNANYAMMAYDRGTLFAEQANGIRKMRIAYDFAPETARSVTVTTPNGGEVWRAGSVHNVTWTSQNLATARIEYRRSASDPWQFITDQVGYHTHYFWLVPDDLTTEAELRIYDPSDLDPADVCDATFTIEAPTVAIGDAPGPLAFAVRQNRPNPFTRMTRIAYTLPVASPVRLEVFDMAGKRVATLVSATQQPGEYAVPFGPGVATATGQRVESLPAGVYFYRFRAGPFTSMRKMVVLD